MTKVGFIDLNKQKSTFKLQGDIERLLHHKWLAPESSQEYYDRMKHCLKDFNRMTALKAEISNEIKRLKELYGVSR